MKHMIIDILDEEDNLYPFYNLFIGRTGKCTFESSYCIFKFDDINFPNWWRYNKRELLFSDLKVKDIEEL